MMKPTTMTAQELWNADDLNEEVLGDAAEAGLEQRLSAALNKLKAEQC